MLCCEVLPEKKELSGVSHSLRQKKKRASLFPLLLVLLVLLTGCTRAVNRAAERRIRDALPDLLGPAKQYRVHIDNAPERTVRGRLANVTVDGDTVQLGNLLLVERIHLDLKGVEVDTDKSQVTAVREAAFVVTVSEASLDEFLTGEGPQGERLRKMHVRLGDNQVTISGEREVINTKLPFLGTPVKIRVPFSLTGPLRVAGPTRMEIDPTRITVVGIPVFGGPLNFIKDRFERSVELERLPFPVQLTEVRSEKGRLILAGKADVLSILQRSPGRPR